MFTTILSIVSTVLTVLFSGGFGILFYRQDKRAKEIQNEHSATQVWVELYEKMKVQNDEQEARYKELNKETQAQIKELIEKLGESKNKRLVLEIENTRLKFECEKLTWLKCEVRGCQHRQPPRTE